MKAHVKLSSDLLIEYLDLCNALTAAVCPTGEEKLSGIDCVIGKIVTQHVPIPAFRAKKSDPFYHAWQHVLTSDDGRTLNELRPSARRISDASVEAQLAFVADTPRELSELTLPSPMSANERTELEQLLPMLPPLRCPMSAEEKDAFLQAYCSLPNRPMWIPNFVTQATINEREVLYKRQFSKIQQALQRDFENGRLAPVNADHIPVATLMPHTFIPRTQVVAYLELYGFSYENFDTVDTAAEKSEIQAEEPPAKGKTRKPGERKISLEQEPEVANFCNKLKNLV
ncbi:hypothetical protein [Burkholderia sp. 3C]